VCSFRRAIRLSSDSYSHSSSLRGVGYVRAGGPCHPIFQAFFFSFSFFFGNHAVIVFRYKKPHAKLAMERTKSIKQTR